MGFFIDGKRLGAHAVTRGSSKLVSAKRGCSWLPAAPAACHYSFLLLLLNHVPHSVIHCVLDINHKAVEDAEDRLCYARKNWDEEKEKKIVFGNGKDWVDAEADKTTFKKTDLGDLAADPACPVDWEQWCGVVQRGRPHTLILQRPKPKMSGKRRTDSATSYKLNA